MTSESQRWTPADIHSHLVPGVDDGARTVDDVLEGIGRFVARGVLRIVTTPHIDAGLTHRRRELEFRLDEIDEAFAKTELAVVAAYPELEFGLGHEIMLDHPEPDLSDPRLRLGGTNWVLVEWPRLQIPLGTPRVIRSLQTQGVQVLIAHPERYLGYDADLSLLERWKEEGARLQVNFGSLLGRYGPEARQRAFRMLEEGWVDCLSSDFHGRPHLRLYMGELEGLFRELQAEEAWSVLTAVNPNRILDGEFPLPAPRVQGRRGVWRRLFEAFRR